MTTEERSKIGRNNKKRGIRYESVFAKLFRTKRYPADSGGKLDLMPSMMLALQVKSGKRVMTGIAREGLDEARSACPESHLAGVAIADNSGARVRKFVMFDADEFVAWLDEISGGPSI